jgi:hypothetical protein
MKFEVFACRILRPGGLFVFVEQEGMLRYIQQVLIMLVALESPTRSTDIPRASESEGSFEA